MGFKNRKLESRTFEGVKVGKYFNNFKGEVDHFNPTGMKTFNIVLDDRYKKEINEMRDEGYNLKPTNTEYPEDMEWTLKVRISDRYYTPAIELIIDGDDENSIFLTMDQVECLQEAKLDCVDLTFNPSKRFPMGSNDKKEYEMASAYLESAAFYIKSDKRVNVKVIRDIKNMSEHDIFSVDDGVEPF